MERSLKFKGELQKILSPFNEMRKDYFAKSQQLLITKFSKEK